jgi:hypothetical protein
MELRAVVRDLSHKMKLMAKSSRLDALGSMDHLWKSIPRLAEGVELSNKSVRGMREDLGDVTKLQGEHNVYDVIEGITLALTSKPWEEEFMVLSDRVTAMANMLSEVDEDHQAAGGRLLLRKLNGMHSPLGGPTSSPGAMAPLSTSMAIVDNHGNHCGTLGDLLQEHCELKNKHSNLKVDFESLSAVVTAQGGLASPPRPWCAFSWCRSAPGAMPLRSSWMLPPSSAVTQHTHLPQGGGNRRGGRKMGSLRLPGK